MTLQPEPDADHSQASAPKRPVLPGFYRVIPMGADLVQVRSAGRVLRVAGPGVGEFGPILLGALDGRETLEMVTERLGLEYRTAADIVRQLHAHRIVWDAQEEPKAGSAGGDEAVLNAYGELGHQPEVVDSAMAVARVALVGLGPVGRLAARQLAAVGAGEVVLVDDRTVSHRDQSAIAAGHDLTGRGRADVALEEAAELARQAGGARPSRVRIAHRLERVAQEVDLMIVEVDERPARAEVVEEACWAAGTTALFHSVGPLEGTLGPLSTPGSAGCHRCLIGRRLSHLRHYDEHIAYWQWLDDGGGGGVEPALLCGLASIMAGLVTLEVQRVTGGLAEPVTRRGVLVADVRTTNLRREPLLPVPGCPVCGGVAAGQAAAAV